MNIKLFILFAVALFVTLWWIANMFTSAVKAIILSQKGMSINDNGWIRLIGAVIAALLWAAVYCI